MAGKIIGPSGQPLKGAENKVVRVVLTPQRMLEDIYTFLPDHLVSIQKNQVILSHQLGELIDHVMTEVLVLRDLAKALNVELRPTAEYMQILAEEKKAFLEAVKKMKEEADKTGEENEPSKEGNQSKNPGSDKGESPKV